MSGTGNADAKPDEIHAETYISAVGAIAGYAAQRTLFAETPPVIGRNIHRISTKSGQQYWYGDALNNMLLPKTEADGNHGVWSLAAGGALGAGSRLQQMPSLDAMFKHVTSTIGGANEGRTSVPAQHQAHLAARDLLKVVWPSKDEQNVSISGMLPFHLPATNDKEFATFQGSRSLSGPSLSRTRWLR